MRRVAPEHADKQREILAALDLSRGSAGMDFPSLRLHLPKGLLKGRYEVSVSGNRRASP